MRVVKDRVGDEDAYFIIAEKAGRMTGKASFEMPLTDPDKGWLLPGGPAAMRQVTLRWDQPGWEFFSPGAARITTLDPLAARESGAVMILGPADPVLIQARPKQRDVSTEETRFSRKCPISICQDPAWSMAGTGFRSARRKAASRRW